MASPAGTSTKLFSFLGSHSSYPYSKRDNAYTDSYRIIRLVIGFLGILLPVIFIIGEIVFLKGGVQVRGSLSAYYHSSMQDAFVGGLCVIGLMLATYMAGEPRTWDFWVSLLAGIAVLGVVFFPTSRPPELASSGTCGSSNAIGCSSVESILGEHQTALVHAACAVAFIICLAIMSLLFGLAEVITDNERSMSSGQDIQGRFWSPARFWTHSGLALVILAAGAWAFWGAELGALKPLYVGEVAAVWAFGVSWLLAGFYLTAPHRTKPVPARIPGPSATTNAGEPY